MGETKASNNICMGQFRWQAQPKLGRGNNCLNSSWWVIQGLGLLIRFVASIMSHASSIKLFVNVLKNYDDVLEIPSPLGFLMRLLCG